MYTLFVGRPDVVGRGAFECFSFNMRLRLHGYTISLYIHILMYAPRYVREKKKNTGKGINYKSLKLETLDNSPVGGEDMTTGPTSGPVPVGGRERKRATCR